MPAPGYTYNTSMFPPAENEFIAAVAAYTGLAPQVVAGWALAEEPPGGYAVASNPYNYLNIGMPGSSYAGTPTTIWQNPLTAAEATAEWIETGQGVPGWSHPGGITLIKEAAGKPIAEQIWAIQHSGWAASGYPDLPQIVAEVAGGGSPPSVPPFSIPGAGTPSGSTDFTGFSITQIPADIEHLGESFFGFITGGISDAINNIAKVFTAIGLFFSALVSPVTWLRAAEIVLGAVLMMIGVTLYFVVLFGLTPSRASTAISRQYQDVGALGERMIASPSAKIIKVVGERQERKQTLSKQTKRTIKREYLVRERPLRESPGTEPRPTESRTSSKPRKGSVASANRKKGTPTNKRAGKRAPRRK